MLPRRETFAAARGGGNHSPGAPALFSPTQPVPTFPPREPPAPANARAAKRRVDDGSPRRPIAIHLPVQPLGDLLILPREPDAIAGLYSLRAMHQLGETVLIEFGLAIDIVRDKVARGVRYREQHRCEE